nr:P-loop NTPase fold protein [Mesorhizobium sp. LNHC220B00]
MAAVFEEESQLGDLTLSPLCAHVLVECVSYLPNKLTQNDILSTSTVFLMALLLARRLATSDSGSVVKASDELDQLRRWGELVLGGFSDRLDVAATRFFQKVPLPDADLFRGIAPGTSPVGVRPGPGLRHVFQTLAGQREIRLADIILRSVDDPEANLPKRIEEWQLGALVRGMKGATKTKAGRIPRMTREADDKELALSVGEYAKALATILRTAEGEFTFALFGPWGSGKTTLTRLLKPLLEDPKDFADQTGASQQLFAKLTYEVAAHNAWKYRQPPEAWVYLYKSLVERASAGHGPLERLALAARSAHFRYGPWPLVGALLSLALLVIPLTETFQLAAILGSLIGTGAIAHIAAITPKVQNKIRAIFEKNAKLSTGPERLGMLALIGEDVKALLSAWTKKPPDDPSVDDGKSEAPSANGQGKSRPVRIGLPVSILTVVTIAWACALCMPPTPHPDGFLVRVIKVIASFIPGGPKDAGSDASQQAFEVATNWAFWVAWVAFAFAMVVGPWIVSAPKPDRVLLIVDDLDRCSPGDMLTVIENLKLLVDDPVLSERLQVLMLVDERVLEHAIAKRYEDMIDERATDIVGETPDNAGLVAKQEIIAEQLEKLFACHLRLPALSDRDVSALAEKLSSRELDETEEQERQAAERMQREEVERAERILRNAIGAQESAKSSVELVRKGEKRVVVDVDGASATPVPKRVRDLGMVDAFLPPTEQEKKERMRRNAAAIEFNRKIEAMTPEQRLAENPDVIRRYDQTVAMVAQAQAELERTRSRPIRTKPREPEPPTFPFTDRDVRFTRDEVRDLGRLVPDYFRAITRRPSPRAIRTLIFKIQLFRLLLQARAPNLPLESFSVISILDAFRQAAQIEPTARQDEEIVAIASQVI